MHFIIDLLCIVYLVFGLYVTWCFYKHIKTSDDVLRTLKAEIEEETE